MNIDPFSKDFTIPREQGGYLKLKEGSTLVKFCTKYDPICGWEFFGEGLDGKSKKPFRREFDKDAFLQNQFDQEFMINAGASENEKQKFFVASVVWNYDAQKYQIWEITQKSIIDKIKTLAANKRGWSKDKYDLEIIREGQGKETRYEVLTEKSTEIELPEPPSIDLTKLFSGEDPFLNKN